jgi:hypothetical protein
MKKYFFLFLIFSIPVATTFSQEEPLDLDTDETIDFAEEEPPDPDTNETTETAEEEVSFAEIFKQYQVLKYIGQGLAFMFKGTVFEGAFKGAQKGLKAIEKEASKGQIPLPPIGMLKFKKYDPKKDGDLKTLELTKAPMFVGTLYDKSGKKEKTGISLGPIKIKHLKIFIVLGEKTPILRCEITLFNKTGYLMQKDAGEGYVKFKVILHKRVRVPTGVKRWAELDEFELSVTPEQRTLTTKTKLFGTPEEDESTVSIDFTPPFPFKVKIKKLPLTSIMGVMKKTPFKKVVLEDVNIKITSIPAPSFDLSGKANLKNVKLGFKSTGIATVSIKLGADGLLGYFNITDVTFPGGFGKAQNAMIRFGEGGGE